MNFDEANEYLSNAAVKGSVYGLESIERLMDRLDNPQKKLNIIHVAGTNGKGSTCAFISGILKSAGYRVGRYTSPTVLSYWERIQINGENISNDAVASLTDKIAKTIEKIVSEGFPAPTVFEIETAMAFLYFKEMQCDFAIIEVGMGGLEDATNIVDNTICACIASISMDHMGFLGNDLASIARNKAGIIKKGCHVVTIRQNNEVMPSITEKADSLGCPVFIAEQKNVFDIDIGYLKLRFSYRSSKKTYENISCGLLGIYQIDNAILAIEAIEALREKGFKVSDQAIYSGIKNAKWHGRFTVLMKQPAFIVDGAHNEDAANQLRQTIESYFEGKKIIYIMGVLSDKEYDKIIEIMMPLAKRVLVVTPPNDRALPGKELGELVKKQVPDTVVYDNINDAVLSGIENADDDDVIVSFGSLYYLGEVIDSIRRFKELKNNG